MTNQEEPDYLKEEMVELEKQGWTLQQDSCSSGSAHEFKVGEPLEGTVRAVRTIRVRRGQEMVKSRLMTLISRDEICTVWESAALSGLFDVARVDDLVRIEYLGDVEMPAPRSPMKDYRVWVKAHDQS